MTDRWPLVRRRFGALPSLAVDTAIAVLCYLATIAVPARGAEPAGWPLFALAALASLPLVWRRRRPIVTAALVGAGTVGLAVHGALLQIPVPYGQLVATYTVALLAPPVWRLIAMSATAVGVAVSALVLLGREPAAMGIAGLPFVVAYALGAALRARRDRIAMLEERTRRLADAQEAVAIRERERIAREIHDIVAHSVSLMVVQAEAGLVQAAAPGQAARRFDLISSTGREALTQLDRALGVLRADGPNRHPQPGFGDLPDLMQQARLAGLDAVLTEHGRRRSVPADLATAVYRLVQEAVTNTVKHAAARRLRVGLGWQDSALRVEVCDDGGGPVPTGVAAGRGLVGMRERVQAFGGELHTGRGDAGTGFRVVAVLPLREQVALHG
jgi:signal transduction histidine kinase